MAERQRFSLVRRLLGARAPGPTAPPPICDSVAAWCAASGVGEVRTLWPAQTFRRRPPRTLEPALHPKFQVQAAYNVPAKYLAVVPGARLVGAEGVVVLPDGSFAGDSMYNRSHIEKWPRYRQGAPARVVRQRGRYFSLLIEYGISGNYYHWLHDVILRLYGVLEHLPADVRLIVPPRLRPFQLETLRLLGLGPERLCEFSGAEAWEIETLYYAPPTMASGADLPAADLWLRDLAWRAYVGRPRRPTRRLFISRAAAQYRRITNEPEIAACLEQYGFETCRPETLSFREQVTLFAEAAVLAGGHGAGHANMLFAPPGLRVLDIFEPVELNRCYWNMSEALGHHYWYMLGDTVPSGHYAGNIHVPADKLLRTLAEVLKE